MWDKKAVLIVLLLIPSTAAFSQLSHEFDSIFSDILCEGFRKSPGEHGDHFIPASELASSELAPALGNLISANISSFPLTSSLAGVTFDPATGQTQTSSLGPIFTEPVATVGDGNVSVGVSATHLSLDRFRGLPLEQMRFEFLHQDVGDPGLGDSPNESDVMDFFLDLHAEANIYALFVTLGVLNNLDLSIAAPIVEVNLHGAARAHLSSATLLLQGYANHYFDGDSLKPVLDKTVPYDASAGGIGDVAFRLKYRFTEESNPLGFAALFDVRVPTGDAKDFLGTGKVTARTILIGSSRMGDFTPHANVGYDFRNSNHDSDEFEFALGFDQVLMPRCIFALEFLGEIDLDRAETPRIFPGSTTVHGLVDNVVDISNIPERRNDNRIDTSVGIRYAPVLTQTVQVQLLANLIVPLQDGGLRSNVSPTVGFSLSF